MAWPEQQEDGEAQRHENAADRDEVCFVFIFQQGVHIRASETCPMVVGLSYLLIPPFIPLCSGSCKAIVVAKR